MLALQADQPVNNNMPDGPEVVDGVAVAQDDFAIEWVASFDDDVARNTVCRPFPIQARFLRRARSA